MSTTPRERFRWALSTVVYVVGGIASGFMAGGILGRILSSGIGIDQLSDVLGGIGIGILCGAVVTVGSARRLSSTAQMRAGLVLLLVAAGLFAVMRAS